MEFLPSPGLLPSRVAQAPGATPCGATLIIGLSPGLPIGRIVPLKSVTELRALTGGALGPLGRAVHGFFDNGGRDLAILSASPDQAIAILDAGLGDFDPALIVAPDQRDRGFQQRLAGHCEARGDRLAILDGPAAPEELTDLPRWPCAVVIAPRIRVATPQPGEPVMASAVAHVAGLLAAAAEAHGISRTPAGLPLRGALGTEGRMSRTARRAWHAAGISILTEEASRGGPVRLWGATTLAGEALGARRTLQLIVRSLRRSLGFTRFHAYRPGAERRGAVVATITDCLEALRRAGHLAGASSEASYAIGCGGPELGAPGLEAGLVVELQVALERPQEFRGLRLLLWSDPGEPDKDEDMAFSELVISDPPNSGICLDWSAAP